MNNNPNEHRFNIYFPGLEEEAPAKIVYYHQDVEEAYSQLLQEYPDCCIVGVPNWITTRGTQQPLFYLPIPLALLSLML